MNNAKRYIVTSALPYANGPLHVGHLSGAYLPADIYVRFLRMLGKDVAFICGSDENGAAITIRAKKEGISPQEIIDKYHHSFVDTFRKANISFDVYHRTSSELHRETAGEFFRSLYEKGEFEEKTTEQYFDIEANQFLADRYIVGTCPKCGHKEAYGDQCENCGSSLSPTELIEPRSTLSGNAPELRETTHWYLPLNKYEDWLTEWLEKGILDGKEHHDPSTWKNHVLGQCKSWLNNGLEPRAMTRDLDWGVDVPSEIPGSQGKKLYVWMDAPIGYISATKQWAIDEGEPDKWKDYWQDEEAALIHFIGKDNIVFHCIIFPAILKAHGKYVLPVNVPANQFLNLEGRKISTSRNWAVWVDEFLAENPELTDSLRYYMIKNMPEQRDSEFTWDGFREANNNELVNNLANFVNRVLVLTNKYYDGVLPEIDESEMLTDPESSESFTFIDAEILRVYDYLFELHQYILVFDFRSALKVLMEISAYGNQLLQNNEPWKLKDAEPEMVKVLMFLCNQVVAVLSIAMRPFMPGKANELRTMLGLPGIKEEGEVVDLMDKFAEGEYIMSAGHKLGSAEHLFSKIDDEWVTKQKNKLESSENAAMENSFPDLKDEIGFEDFMKMDIRTGTVIHAEKVPKTKKLLKLEIDLGFEKRTVVSGIAEYFDPEELDGRRVSVVANLAPKKLRGIMSKGMILMSEDADGRLHFVSPPKQAENGMPIK